MHYPVAHTHAIITTAATYDSVSYSTGMGTPQLRWREMHHSVRLLTMAWRRCRLTDGVIVTPLNASTAASCRRCRFTESNGVGGRPVRGEGESTRSKRRGAHLYVGKPLLSSTNDDRLLGPPIIPAETSGPQ